MDLNQADQLITYLRDFATPERWDKIEEIAAQRTRHFTVVLEDIYQPHNASAVLRSCDGFGIQDVHIIENHNSFSTSPDVTIGADQWLTIQRYNEEDEDNTSHCIHELKSKGYKVIATTPHKDDITLNELKIQEPIALMFGSEVEGISDKAKELADGFMKIPMFGFSESFNISVSAAISLYNITRRLRENENIHWQLNKKEETLLKLEWLKQSIKAGPELSEKFIKENF